jgi:uncharacterized protein with von Willebrand factor type A (vWA) domain
MSNKPTLKQIAYARKLGIDNPTSYTVSELSHLISAAVKTRRAKAASSTKVKVIPKENIEVIEKDAYDRMAFESVVNSEKIRTIYGEESGEQEDQNRQALVEDVFACLYKLEPEVKKEQASLIGDLVQNFLQLKEYQDFHNISQVESIMSGIGTVHLAPALIEQLEEIEEQIEKQREEQKKKNKQQGKDENEGVPQGAPRLDELGEQGMSQLRQAMRKAVEAAEAGTEEAKELLTGWGVQAGEIQQRSPHEILNILEQLKNNVKLKDISKLVGRMQNTVRAATATSPYKGAEEIIDIGLGSDISHALPSELMKLTTQPLLFYKDMLEGNLLSYQLQGQEALAQGPLLVCLDISGSMAGHREVWAKAVTLALMAYAGRERRKFGYVLFAEKVYEEKFFTSGVKIEDKIAFASRSNAHGGGTDFESPLDHCAGIIESNKEFTNADIVFITDGECEVRKEFIKEFQALKEKTHFRVFSLGISSSGSAPWDAANEFKTLLPFSDYMSVVNNTGDMSSIEEVARLVDKRKGLKE